MTVGTTRLGKSGLVVSNLCLGTMTFGLQSDESSAQEILNAAFDEGIYFIDTADVYPLGGGVERVGITEEIVGRWVEGRRDEVILATKFVGKTGARPYMGGASRKHIFEAVEASLRRLKTDYIDLYQLHSYDSETPIEETLGALDDLVRSGKVRYIGCSNFKAWQLARALGKSETHRFTSFTSVQPRYNLLFREIERELLPLCQVEGIGVIPYNPIAGGLLSGKHDSASGPTEGTRFNTSSASGLYRERYWHERMFETVEALKKAASEAGVSLVTLAVAWVRSQPAISSPIIGASRAEQLKDSIQGATYEIDEDLLLLLNELTREYRQGDADR